jgi:hypothetical protein
MPFLNTMVLKEVFLFIFPDKEFDMGMASQKKVYF